MGLDITAYRQLKPAPDAKLDEDGYPVEWDRHIAIRADQISAYEKHWPGRAAGLVPGVYSAAETDGFRAGSYSGYNAWRDWLATMAGWGSARACWDSGKTEGPFFELIHFSDCEGLIGPVVAAKLAKDFQDHAERIAGTDPDDATWEQSLYRRWQEAFEMAADGGCVDFH